MLCADCDTIVLDFRSSSVRTQIRTYVNLSSLRTGASSCEFCQVLYETAQELDHPDCGSYCRSKWGPQIYAKALGQSPIGIYHIAAQGDHNILADCMLDAQSVPGYIRGPKSLHWTSILGGICTQPGDLLAV